MATLCLNMIVKNEAAIIEECLESVAPVVSYYVVCDTGSSDGTVERIRACMARYGVPGEIHHVPFVDFSQARNAALDLARRSSGAFDYLLLLDADMSLLVDDPWFRDRLEAPVYAVRQHNGLSYYNVRLLRRDHPASYRGATHEYLASAGPAQRLDAISFLDHASGSSRASKSERDVGLLTAELEREPDNRRAMFYLAQTYREAGQPELAIAWYERRIASGGWDEEVWYSRYGIARCRQMLGDHAGLVDSAWAAYRSRPTRAEPLHLLARHYRETGQHEACMEVCELGAAIPFPSDSLFVESDVYATGFQEEMAISGYYCASPARRAAGHAACEAVALDRRVRPEMRWAARRNLCHYARPLAELAGPVEYRRIAIPADAGFALMNPSVAAVGDRLLCLVRSVNYRVVDGVYHAPSGHGEIETRNWLVELDGRLDPTSVVRIEDRSGGRTFPTGVVGVEDCRLATLGNALWVCGVVADRRPDGLRQVVLGRLGGDGRIVSLDVQRSFEPELTQKNWVPLTRDGELLLLYSADPTVVLRVEADRQARHWRTTVPDAALEHLRGGSQPVRVDDGWLYLTHEVSLARAPARVYLHRFVLLDDDLVARGASPAFCFHARGVEFAAGLARDPAGGRFIVSFGVGDREAWLAGVDESAVRALLRPLAG